MNEKESRFLRTLKAWFLIRPPVEDDPRTVYSSKAKIGILVVISLSTAMSSFAGTIYYPGMPDIIAELGASTISTTLTASLYVLFSGIFPIFWGALSDYYEIRRFVMIVSLTIFTVSSFALAIINNIWGLLVLRCVQAIGASAGQAVGNGVVTDLYPIEQRGGAYGTFFLGVFLGPILAPTIGGFLVMTSLTWRATFWFCVGFGGFLIIMTVFFVPETYRDSTKFDDKVLPSATVTTPQQTDTAPSSVDVFTQQSNKNSFNPIGPLLLLKYPNILLPSLASGIMFGVMFSIETVIPNLFQQTYGFIAWQTGLSYLGATVGHISGVIISGKLSDRLLLVARSKRTGGLHKIEDRITLNIWPCCLIFIPGGLLLFGWSVYRGLTFWVPIVAFGIQCFGTIQVSAATGAYLSDATPGQAASASAARICVHMIFGSIFAVSSTPIVESIGSGYLTVILAALSWVSAAILLVIKCYGQQIRRRFGFEQESEQVTQE